MKTPPMSNEDLSMDIFYSLLFKLYLLISSCVIK